MNYTMSTTYDHITSVTQLEGMLDRAVKREAYEEAAKLKKRLEEVFVEQSEIKVESTDNGMIIKIRI